MTKEQEKKFAKLIQPLVEEIVKKHNLNEGFDYKRLGSKKSKGSAKLVLNVTFDIREDSGIYKNQKTGEEIPETTYELDYDRESIEKQIENQMLSQMQKISGNPKIFTRGSAALLDFINRFSTMKDYVW